MFSCISREDILYDPVKGLLRFLQNLYSNVEFVQNSL
jgi:hypothetical protein